MPSASRVAVGALAAAGTAAGALALPVFGGTPRGARLDRMHASPQWRDGRFRNALPALTQPGPRTILDFWTADRAVRTPAVPVPTVARTQADFDTASDLRLTWLGHSTTLIEIEGRRFLTDPVFGPTASPGRAFGVARFFEPPLPLADLPAVDAVVLSHDHYDHLDMGTVRRLAGRVPRWVAPLGVGAHLERWGVPADRITELDWWDETEIGGVRLVCTPARHFSGRGLTNRDGTLWSGWAFLGETHRVYSTGDGAFSPDFARVGERLGPFDAALVEIGAYSAAWPDVHMGPEQAVQAHLAARGGLLVPVHWATFNLAFHGWTEPVERLLVAAEAAGVSVAVPRPGASIEPADPPGVERWWPEVPWQTADERPIVSSGL
ncbi:MAG TPA: MBL fold metallo-hydrolase [Rubricoccaceae bacterium]|jgi:L-ascorbate metabolism protein UlaG (beta-lactamase superfamily)